MQLRDYQQEIIDRVRDRDIVTLPTGTGKTAIIANLAKRYAQTGHKVLVVVPTVDLKSQTRAVLELWGATGVEVAVWKSAAKITADVYLHDECHHSASTTWEKLLERPGTHIGFTATPYRFDNRPLKGFERVLEPHLMSWYMERGHLSTPCEFSVDLGIEPDWEENLEGQFLNLNRRHIYGTVLDEYVRIVPSKAKSIVFGTTIKHCEYISHQFQSIGVTSVPIHCQLPPRERADILRAFRAGHIQQLTNVQLLTEGVDVPDVAAVLMLRSTSSLSLYYQMIGRAIRPKPVSYILDFVGNIYRHGSVKHNLGWEDCFKQAFEASVLQNTRVVLCRYCGAVLSYTAQSCPECGQQSLSVVSAAQLPKERHGQLKELSLSGFQTALMRAAKQRDASKVVEILCKASKFMVKGDEALLIQFLYKRFSDDVAAKYHSKIMKERGGKV